MNFKKQNNSVQKNSFPDNFVDFIDLTDGKLEELHIPEIGFIQGGSRGWGNRG